MTNQIFIFTLSLILWVFLGYRFLRAFVRHKLTTGAALFAWVIFFLCYLVVALDVPSVEAQINVHFSGLPISTLLRGEAILLTAQLYFWGSRYIDRPSKRMKRIFNLLNPLIMLFCIVVFLGMTYAKAPNEVILHTVKVMREATMLVWTPFVFWPAIVGMKQLEEYRPMKLRYTLSLIFYASFILNCAAGILWTFTVFFVPSLQTQAFAVDQLSALLCLIQFVIMLFPFRWLVVFFYPPQLRLYFRLRRLREAVRYYANAHPPTYQLSYNLTRLSDIELAIYQQVIEILDMYPSIDSAGDKLRSSIQEAAESEPQYTELVDRLAAIPI